MVGMSSAWRKRLAHARIGTVARLDSARCPTKVSSSVKAVRYSLASTTWVYAAPSSTGTPEVPMRRSSAAARAESSGPRSTSRCPRKFVDWRAVITPSEHSSKSSDSAGVGPGTNPVGRGSASASIVWPAALVSETRVR